jgi:hypothetical protein
MEESKKFLFKDIPTGSEFIANSVLKTVLIKVDDDHYKIKGQDRIWKANKKTEYALCQQ